MIRQAKVKDSESLCQLLHQLGYASDVTQVEQLLINNNNSDANVYVYELLAKVVGFISLIRFFYFPTMQYITRITAICVDEQHRDLGIGSQLLAFAENWAASFGDITVEITCSIQREQTHRFYLQHGYSQHSYKFIKQLNNMPDV
ncbi:MAG: GNAT family N-acetyltransferase [Waterburya sp.]